MNMYSVNLNLRDEKVDLKMALVTLVLNTNIYRVGGMGHLLLQRRDCSRLLCCTFHSQNVLIIWCRLIVFMFEYHELEESFLAWLDLTDQRWQLVCFSICWMCYASVGTFWNISTKIGQVLSPWNIKAHPIYKRTPVLHRFKVMVKYGMGITDLLNIVGCLSLWFETEVVTWR